MQNNNWKTAWKSAKHVVCVFAAAVLIGEFWAIPVWMRITYASALGLAWFLVYRIELAFNARRTHSAQIRSTRDPQNHTPTAVRVPAVIYPESDAAIDAEENAIFHLMMMGATRADAARLVRILCDSARRHAKTKRLEEKFLVDFENHSSKARA